jgi:hypothetical protein
VTDQEIERHHQRWFSIHVEAKPFKAKAPLGAKLEWPSRHVEDGKVIWAEHGKYGSCDWPVSGVQMWCFESRSERDAFVEKYAGDGVVSA